MPGSCCSGANQECGRDNGTRGAETTGCYLRFRLLALWAVHPHHNVPGSVQNPTAGTTPGGPPPGRSWIIGHAVASSASPPPVPTLLAGHRPEGPELKAAKNARPAAECHNGSHEPALPHPKHPAQPTQRSLSKSDEASSGQRWSWRLRVHVPAILQCIGGRDCSVQSECLPLPGPRSRNTCRLDNMHRGTLSFLACRALPGHVSASPACPAPPPPPTA